MDIHKEREAFEKEMLNSRYVAGNISAFWDKKTQDYDIEITELRMAWHAWQAAKAQAVPEGFVLVKASDIAKLAIAVSRVDLMTYSEERPDSEKLAWQNVANKLEAMIEAQENS